MYSSPKLNTRLTGGWKKSQGWALPFIAAVGLAKKAVELAHFFINGVNDQFFWLNQTQALTCQSFNTFWRRKHFKILL